MTWLTLLATAAVVAINVAGLWEITAARASLLDGARRMLGLETAARAGILEARLAQARGDLAFMAGSPVFFDLKAVLASRDPREARWRRLEAEGAVLLFLRGHDEVMRAVVRDEKDTPLIEAERRGGVPVLWMSAGAPPVPVRREPDPVLQPIEGRFEPRLGTRTVQGAVTIEVVIDGARLLSGGRPPAAGEPVCLLRDARGGTLAQTRCARGRSIHPIGECLLGRRAVEDHQVADDHPQCRVLADGPHDRSHWTHSLCHCRLLSGKASASRRNPAQ